MSATLRFENVQAAYGEARILHGVSLDVSSGERVALLGRNGVGKTTVVNVLCGLASLREGRISIGEQKFETLRGYSAALAGVAIVPQGRRILPNLTVEENLILGSASRRKGPWSLKRIYELFPILKERAGQLGTRLSGGQQQMLAIGRALMVNPDILLLDEPSEGLAPVIVDELAELFVRLAKNEGMGLLLIEQTISLVQRVAERCYVLSKGKIVEARAIEGWTTEEMQAHIAV